MEVREELNEVLNDLLKINNDRIAGYEKAIAEAREHDISFKELFQNMISESEKFKAELAEEITRAGGVVEDETTTSGNIYRAWMDIKATFTDKDETTILDSCYFGEEAAQRAYDSALAADSMLDPEVRSMVESQQQQLRSSMAVIKSHLDAHLALKNATK